MSALVSTASGLPPVPYIPAFGHQLDYNGEADKTEYVLWHNRFTQPTESERAAERCEHAVLDAFNGSASLLLEPPYQASPAWMPVPFEKRWIDAQSGGEVSANLADLYSSYYKVSIPCRRPYLELTALQLSRLGRAHAWTPHAEMRGSTAARVCLPSSSTRASSRSARSPSRPPRPSSDSPLRRRSARRSRPPRRQARRASRSSTRSRRASRRRVLPPQCSCTVPSARGWSTCSTPSGGCAGRCGTTRRTSAATSASRRPSGARSAATSRPAAEGRCCTLAWRLVSLSHARVLRCSLLSFYLSM